MFYHAYEPGTHATFRLLMLTTTAFSQPLRIGFSIKKIKNSSWIAHQLQKGWMSKKYNHLRFIALCELITVWEIKFATHERHQETMLYPNIMYHHSPTIHHRPSKTARIRTSGTYSGYSWSKQSKITLYLMHTFVTTLLFVYTNRIIIT